MIKPLTSMRMIFALFVFVSHLSLLENYDNYRQLFQKYFFEGFLGVSFFFILSGFILSYSYKERFDKNIVNKKKFYIARFARIYPMHFVTMIAALLINLLLNIKDNYLLQNMFLVQSFFSDERIFFSLNAPSWSISDEMFFYLAFPFLILLNKNVKTLIFITITLTIVLFNLIGIDKHYWLYISPFTRIADFILGMLVYEFFILLKFSNFNDVKFNTGIEVSSLIIFIIFFMMHDYVELGYRYSIYYWIPMSLIIFTFSVSGISQQQGVFSKWLSNKYLVYLGEISFCFYLIHLIVLRVTNGLLPKIFIDIKVEILIIIAFIITLFASALSYRFIEKPLNIKIKEHLL